MKVEFHGIAAGGDAVGRDASGRVVFAPYGAPGDVAEVALDEEHRAYARGHIIELLTASPQRLVPQCPYYLPVIANDLGPACGGCQIQHLADAAQLETKRGIVRDALSRIAGLERAKVEALVQPCVAAPLPYAYRNKADFVVSLEHGQPKIGFCARGSHRVVDIARCPIQQEPNNELLAAARICVNEGLAPPFDPATGRGVLRRLVTRTGGDGATLLIAVTTRAPWPQLKDFARQMRQQVPALAGVLWRAPHREAVLVDGRDWLEEEVDGLRLRITGEGFFQINTALTPRLVETVLRLAAMQPGQHALDLYCGAGLFALALARRGARVVGLEANRTAVRDARANASRNSVEGNSFDRNSLGASHVLFHAGDAARQLRDLPAAQWDLLVLDPPRAGAAASLPEIMRLQPRRLVYVSCDPATLARDVKRLIGHGYRLHTVVPLDLFPQTAHVETVARLDLAI